MQKRRRLHAGGSYSPMSKIASVKRIKDDICKLLLLCPKSFLNGGGTTTFACTNSLCMMCNNEKNDKITNIFRRLLQREDYICQLILTKKLPQNQENTTFSSYYSMSIVHTAPVIAKTTRLHLKARYCCIQTAYAKGRVISLRGESLYFSFHQKWSAPFLGKDDIYNYGSMYCQNSC